ncbi:MAG: hypothetical protein JW888_07845 [Pirellulales bacterium]|nr:hypothetical protein [Pirellulales bacterium]
MRDCAFVILGLLLSVPAVGAESTKITYPPALDAAAISVPRLDSIHEYALIIGNGDINALVYQETDRLVLRITKNDVWDARQFAAAMCVSELLLQSVGDVIRVFPARPKDKSARFTDLRAQGGFLVSAECKESQVTRLRIRSTVGGPCRVLNPWPSQDVECRKGTETLTVKPEAQDTLVIDTQPDDVLFLSPARGH